MSPFAILGVPVFALFCFALDRWLNAPLLMPEASSSVRPIGQAYQWSLLWGFLYAIPSYFIALLLGRIFPVSFRPFLLYLYGLGRDHLFQLALLVLAFFTFFRHKDFRELAFFAAGYLSLINFAGAISVSAQRNVYGLFLLPASRIAALLLLPYLFCFCRESYGMRRALFLALLALVPLVGALIAFFSARYWLIASIIFCVVLFASSIGVLVYGRRR